MSINKVIDYWDRQPCNIKHSNSEYGTKQWSDEITARKYFVEPHILEFAQFSRWKDKDVLELGCGIGTDAVNFCKAGANYLGVDISSKSVEIANLRLKLNDLKPACYYANIEHLYLDKKYDLIYSFGVLHHTPNPLKAIQCINKYIKSDGEFRLMLYARSSWKYIMIQAGLDQYEAQSDCPVAYTFDEDRLRSLLYPYFQVVDIKQTHIFPYVVEEYKKYNYELQPYFKAMSPEMFAALENSLGWHLLITAISR